MRRRMKNVQHIVNFVAVRLHIIHGELHDVHEAFHFAYVRLHFLRAKTRLEPRFAESEFTLFNGTMILLPRGSILLRCCFIVLM